MMLGGFVVREEEVIVGGGNLNNCTFSGWVWVAFDPRETREKYTTNGNKGNLNNRTVLAEERGVPVYQSFL